MVRARADRAGGDGPQQHDLRHEVAARFVAGARIRAGERVLDAGAGLGAITAELLAAGAQVTAAEFAPDRLTALRRRFGQACEIVAADLRSWDPGFVGPWRVVANPPFHLTAQLVAGWVLGPRPPAALDLVLQHETAEKLSAPGTRSGALLACAGEATFVARLPREAKICATATATRLVTICSTRCSGNHTAVAIPDHIR